MVDLYLTRADRGRLDPTLDQSVANYIEQFDEDGQGDFKGKAKAFIRTYGFLSSILVEEDLSMGILEAIDMDGYRVEKRAVVRIQFPDADAEIEPVPGSGGGSMPEPGLDRLSNIIKSFNEQFGNVPWEDADRLHKVITEEIPERVNADQAYRNARQNSDKQNARIEHYKASVRVMTSVMKDHTELFQQFMDNDGFKRWMSDTVFGLTYQEHGSGRKPVSLQWKLNSRP